MPCQSGIRRVAHVVSIDCAMGPSILQQTRLLRRRQFGALQKTSGWIVTGSNIPTVEEAGPNSVDTYRPVDLEKLGVRNATDLLTNIP